GNEGHPGFEFQKRELRRLRVLGAEKRQVRQVCQHHSAARYERYAVLWVIDIDADELRTVVDTPVVTSGEISEGLLSDRQPLQQHLRFDGSRHVRAAVQPAAFLD